MSIHVSFQFSERYSYPRDLPDFARLTSTIINHEHIAWSACGVGLFRPKKIWDGSN